jgi:predicted nucleotidyltransferase
MTRPPCPGATTALAIAGSVLRTRYAGTSFAYVAGSIMRGQGTYLCDIDLVIALAEHESARLDGLLFDGDCRSAPASWRA